MSGAEQELNIFQRIIQALRGIYKRIETVLRAFFSIVFRRTDVEVVVE